MVSSYLLFSVHCEEQSKNVYERTLQTARVSITLHAVKASPWNTRNNFLETIPSLSKNSLSSWIKHEESNFQAIPAQG